MERHAPTRIRSLALLATAALTVSLAACGDDDDDDTSGGDVTTASTTATTAPDTASDTTTASSTDDTATTDAGSGDSTDDTELDERLDAATEALRDGDFSRMLELLELSGVADELEGREMTILAPTDDAFDALTDEELEDLATNPTQIDDIIKRHILDELLTYDELKERTEVTTMSDETLTVEVDGDEVRVNGALVTPPEDDAVSGESGQEVAVFGIDMVMLEST